MRLERFLANFEESGYDDYENLLFQMSTSNCLTDQSLREEVGVEDRKAREKILSQLNEGREREMKEGGRNEKNERRKKRKRRTEGSRRKDERVRKEKNREEGELEGRRKESEGRRREWEEKDCDKLILFLFRCFEGKSDKGA